VQLLQTTISEYGFEPRYCIKNMTQVDKL